MSFDFTIYVICPAEAYAPNLKVHDPCMWRAPRKICLDDSDRLRNKPPLPVERDSSDRPANVYYHIELIQMQDARVAKLGQRRQTQDLFSQESLSSNLSPRTFLFNIEYQRDAVAIPRSTYATCSSQAHDVTCLPSEW